jgi:ATP-dependent Lon protease
VPAPLRDRLEVLELPGYDRAERIRIGRLALLPQSLAAVGVTPAEVTVEDDAVELLAGLDNERGVRQLRRNIEAVVRRAVVQLMDDKQPVVVDANLAEEWLEMPTEVRRKIGFRTSHLAPRRRATDMETAPIQS